MGVVCLVAGAAMAAPRVGCRAHAVGDRAIVEMTLEEFLDRDLVELIRLGLAGKLRVEATLYRRRRFWFDERLAFRQSDADLGWKAGGLALDGLSVAEPGRLRLPALVLWPGQSFASGSHYVEVTATLEVVTAASLGKMTRWLVGGAGAPGRSTVSRALLDVVADDLARGDTGRCAVSRPDGAAGR